MRAMGPIAMACAMAWMPAVAGGTEAQQPAGVVPVGANALPGFKPPAIKTLPTLLPPGGESREALVYVRFIISEKGIPAQLQVLQDRGFHNQNYRNEALRYVQSMRFAPAELDGVPVQYGPLVQPIRFDAGLTPEQQGVTPAFRQEMKKVEELFRKGDYAGAGRHADWMLRDKVRYRYEFAVLQAELARAHAAAGNRKEALEAVIRATGRTVSEAAGFQLRAPPPPNDPSKYLLPRDLVVSLLELRMQLHAVNGELIQALKTYSEMAGLVKINPDDRRAVLAEQLASLLEGNNALVFHGQVAEVLWSHELFRPRFTVQNAKGKLGAILLRCRGQYREIQYAPETAWSVPDGAKGCVVDVYGEPGVSFELVELPAS